LNSPCELPPGGGSYIRHMQVTGEGQLNVINKSGAHSVLNVERDINIDTLTCDTLVALIGHTDLGSSSSNREERMLREGGGLCCLHL